MASDSTLSNTDRPMNEPTKYKRKLLNFSVKREMQFRMIGKIFLLLFISLLLSSLIFFFFSNREVTSSYQMFHVKAQNFLDFLLPAVLGSFVISLVVGAIGSLFFPKPIAGGVYRIEQDLKAVLETGDLTKQIKLRDGDQVASLAEGINTLLQNYRERMNQIDAAIEPLESSVNAEGPEQSSEIRQKAQQTCVKVRAELQQFNY